MNARRLGAIAVVLWCIGFTASAVQGQKIYWADRSAEKIQRVNLDGSGLEDLITVGLTNPRGMALDLEAGKMYWGEALRGAGGRVRRANLDGSGIEDLVTGILGVLDVAVDPVGGKLYWSGGFDNSHAIDRADLDGSNVERVFSTGVPAPLGIALHVDAGKIYWTLSSGAGSRIQRANLDGTEVEDLVTTGLDTPAAIALDTLRGRMYWTDSGAGKLRRARLYGGAVEDLVSTGNVGMRGIAVDVGARRIYWSESSFDRIQSANLDGTGVRTILPTGARNPWGLALDVPPPLPLPIPALSEWGLFAMACLLVAGASVLILRRTRNVRTLSAVATLIAGVVAGPGHVALGQPATIPAELVMVAIDSGSVSAQGDGSEAVVVSSEVVSVPDAPWVRLHFQTCDLSGSPQTGDGSFLRITSLLDGHVQILNAGALRQWRNTTAYFNGAEVLVELLAHPGTGGNRLVIDRIKAGLPADGESCSGTDGLCGSDDRDTSTDPRAARYRFLSNDCSTSGFMVQCLAVQRSIQLFAQRRALLSGHLLARGSALR